MTAKAELALDLAGRPAGRRSSIDIVASAELTATLPGLTVRVNGIRSALRFRVVDENGDFLFNAQLDSPELTGAAVTVDLSGAQGGGYLDIGGDSWRGAISADLGPISVTGLAILTVKDFSLLVLLAAEFAVPIQLSFGFTLLGIGGIIGINRRADVAALHEGLSSGEVGSMLFPRDVIAEAPRLLPAVNRFFPKQADSTVVGPMAKLGWGTPTLVSAAIGVLISSEGILVVGKLAMTLPFDQLPLIKLQGAVLATATADGLDMSASLTDSHLAGMPVAGDMALRIGSGPGGLFALSAGGFHSEFTPPDGMTGMKRIGTEISYGSVLRARLDAFLAITTSSVQFGADAELSASIGEFGIHGGFGFEALILLEPFGFQADFRACVSIECADFDVASVRMNGHLSGTAPWRIHAHAHIKVAVFTGSVDIPPLTWGQRSAQSLPPARDPVAVLTTELTRAENWSATSDAVAPLVRLRPGTDAHSLVHPLAALQFVQNAVPLGIELALMDSVALPASTLLTISVPDKPSLTPRKAQFAPSQFFDLDKNARLASAGYAEFDGGFAVTVDAVVPHDDADIQTVTLAPEVAVMEVSSLRWIGPSVWAALQCVRTPRPAIELLITVRDPAKCLVTHVNDLQSAVSDLSERLGLDLDQVSAMTVHAGIAESLTRRAGPGDLQITRIWEAVTP